MKSIVVFASGSGTNVANIHAFFKYNQCATILKIYTNNSKAYVIERAKAMDIPCCIFNKEQLSKSDFVINLLKKDNPDLIVLAGFLWQIPISIISEFRNKIINIHPALLPKYGGKGMFGNCVHEAVIANKERQSGISIHYVNENYDEGAMIFQATCDIVVGETADSLATKVHELEYLHYPQVIRFLLER